MSLQSTKQYKLKLCHFTNNVFETAEDVVLQTLQYLTDPTSLVKPN